MIEAGKGVVVGAERFIHWQDTESAHNVSAIGVSGWEETGLWEFSNFESKRTGPLEP